MGSATVSAGTDSWVSQNFPTRNHGSDKYLSIRSTSPGANGGVGMIYFRSPVPAGATVTSAKIRIRTYRVSPAQSQTLALRRITQAWTQAKVTFNTYPSYVATAASTYAAPASMPSGTWLEFDVTSTFQNFANGTKNYGFRIDTTGTAGVTYLRAFGSDYPPMLEVSWSDAPNAPVNLRPNGIVSIAKPTLSFDHKDPSGDQTIQAVQFQLDATGDFGSPDFDSGAALTDAAELDLSQDMNRSASITTTATSTTVTAPAATFETYDVGAAITGTGIPAGTTITAVASDTSATISAAATEAGTVSANIGRRYAGLADGATVYYRARVQDGAGLWSAWSDDAMMTRKAKPAITVVSPAAGTDFAEVSPPVVWSVSSQTAYRVTAARVDNGKTVFDSGRTGGSASSITLSTLPEDSDVRVTIRTWDSITGRVASPGDPTESVVTFTAHVDTDSSVDDPTGVTVAQVGRTPSVDISWSRATMPDEFVLLVDGQVAEAHLDPADLTTDGLTYSYRYDGARPNKPTTYTVRAVVNGAQSPGAASATVTVRVEGVWLIQGATRLPLMGDDEGTWEMPDDATVYEPLGGKAVIRVVHGMRGWQGRMDGFIFDGFGGTYADLTEAAYKIKRNPTEPVRLVAGDVNFRALIGDVSVAPTAKSREGQLHRRVGFSFGQVDDFEF